jgi:hypothetical protein
MKRTQIYLDEGQDARLEKRARASGVTKSALIRVAIDALLEDGAPGHRKRLRDALSETAGALPGLEIPSRDEWDRGRA